MGVRFNKSLKLQRAFKTYRAVLFTANVMDNTVLKTKLLVRSLSYPKKQMLLKHCNIHLITRGTLAFQDTVKCFNKKLALNFVFHDRNYKLNREKVSLRPGIENAFLTRLHKIIARISGSME